MNEIKIYNIVNACPFFVGLFSEYSECLCNLFIKRVSTNKIDHVCSRLKLQRNKQSDKPNVETVISKQYDTICQLGHEAYTVKLLWQSYKKSKVSDSIKIKNLLDTGMQISKTLKKWTVIKRCAKRRPWQWNLFQKMFIPFQRPWSRCFTPCFGTWYPEWLLSCCRYAFKYSKMTSYKAEYHRHLLQNAKE